jgi:hypothetical protein
MLQNLKDLFKQQSYSSVGICIQPNGLWVTHVDIIDNQLYLKNCEFLSSESTDKRKDLLKIWVKTHKLANHPCLCVLTPDIYHLIQVLAPQNVPEKEQINVLRWQVQDILRFPAKDAIIDTFKSPQKTNKEGPAKLNLVAIPPHTLTMVKDIITPSKLRLTSVDISELSLCNAIRQHENAKNCIALIHLFPDSGLILFIQEGELSLSVHTNTGLSNLQNNENSHNDLIFDTKRAIEHYDTNFSQNKLDRLFLNIDCDNGVLDNIFDLFYKSFDVTIELVDVEKIISGVLNTSTISTPIAPSALPTIGVAIHGQENPQ